MGKNLKSPHNPRKPHCSCSLCTLAESSRTIFKISTAGGKLFSEVEGGGKGELLAASDNDFAIIRGEQIIKINFVKDSNEEVEQMRIVDGGQVFYANRVK